MNADDSKNSKKADKTLVRIIIAIILVAVLNAGISVITAYSIKSKYDTATAQQKQQSQIVFKRLCITLESLHADQPPSGNTANNPSRAYLQDLHDRLGELATDLKC